MVKSIEEEQEPNLEGISALISKKRSLGSKVLL